MTERPLSCTGRQGAVDAVYAALVCDAQADRFPDDSTVRYILSAAANELRIVATVEGRRADEHEPLDGQLSLT